MKKVLFIKNAIILTATSLILRLLGIFIKIWLASEIGSEGIGLYQLVFSFYVLAATFTTGGITTAVTRLVADELCLGSKEGIKKIMARAFALSLFVAAFSFVVVFVGADFIAVHIITDQRGALSLKILGFSLFFMGVSSCIKGYFIAKRRVLPPSTAQIFEQAVRIIAIMFHVKHFAPLGIEYGCAAVLLADVIAETASCLYLYLFYKAEDKKPSQLCGRAMPDYAVGRKILHIAAPISGSRYITSILRTVENSIVPRGLAAYGMDSAAALSGFGMIKGMVLPLLFFPSSLLNSLSTLLIPEISEAVAKKHHGAVSVAIEKIIKITSAVGFIFGAVFFVAGRELGVLIYKDYEVGNLICRLAPLVPLMYLDSISDGMLKGLDQQVSTFRHSVLDSTLRIILILLFLSRLGMDGFILIMYISNILTCLLNLIRLIRFANVKLQYIRSLFLPALASTGITLCLDTLLRHFNLPNIIYISAITVFSIAIYAAFLLLSGSITIDEIRNFR